MLDAQEIPKRKRRSGKKVRQLVAEFEESGLRTAEFCRKHGLRQCPSQKPGLGATVAENGAKLMVATGSCSNQEFKLEARAGGDDGGDLVLGR